MVRLSRFLFLNSIFLRAANAQWHHLPYSSLYPTEKVAVHTNGTGLFSLFTIEMRLFLHALVEHVSASLRNAAATVAAYNHPHVCAAGNVQREVVQGILFRGTDCGVSPGKYPCITLPRLITRGWDLRFIERARSVKNILAGASTHKRS